MSLRVSAAFDYYRDGALHSSSAGSRSPKGNMAKRKSQPLYPINISANGIPANLCKNKTPDGKFQIARVLKPGGPQEGEFEVLWEGDNEWQADAFSTEQIKKDYPDLISR
jgi:hypothetical protein